MTLDWTFSFVEITNGNPDIILTFNFRDGRAQLIATPEKYPAVINQMKPVMTLLSYVAYFPNKDFTKLKLDTEGHHFAIHYLDKRFLEHKFLGVLSVSEFQSNAIYEYWGVEEMMAEYVFDYFMDMKTDSMLNKINFYEFHEWLKPEIESFYEDWKEAKQKFFSSSQNVKTLMNLPEEEQVFEQWWDLQLINEYGAPLTDLISFINEYGAPLNEGNEQVQQSLESMSISALKILIDSQGGWNIKYLKNRLKNEMGYSYVFFEKFRINDIKYLLIMNSAVYHFEKERCIQLFRGNEFIILNKLAAILSTQTLFFNDSENGLLDGSQKDMVQDLILKCIKNIYS